MKSSNQFAIFFAAFAVSMAANASVSVDSVPKNSKYYAQPQECVAYARRFASFPSGMWTLADKKAMINTGTPKSGRVAVIDAGAYGHVAVVVDVDSSGKNQHIKIAETNYPIGNGSRFRTATCKKIDDCERQLRIVGYHK